MNVLRIGLLSLAPMLAIAAGPTIPQRIPGTPEEAQFNTYKRLVQLEQQVRTLQQENQLQKQEIKELQAAASSLDPDIKELQDLALARDPQIDALEKRVQALESGPREPASPAGKSVTNRVVAPFEVVNAAGKPLFAVTELTSGNTARVSVGLSPSGDAQLVVKDATGQRRAAVAQYGTGALIGTVTSTGMFQTLLVSSAEKGPALTLTRADGKGLLNADSGGIGFKNAAGNTVVALGTGPHEGGVIEVMDSGGNKMIEAGTTTGGVGTVRAGPLYKCGASPMAMGLGLPDCILGHKQ
jgi:hypothetical protein